MALKKLIVAANGLPLTYHKISLVSIETNQQITLLIHSYLNEEARQFEKDYAAGLIAEEYPTLPYVADKYVSFEYLPTIEKFEGAPLMECAYNLLRESMPELADAENV